MIGLRLDLGRLRVEVQTGPTGVDASAYVRPAPCAHRATPSTAPAPAPTPSPPTPPRPAEAPERAGAGTFVETSHALPYGFGPDSSPRWSPLEREGRSPEP